MNATQTSRKTRFRKALIDAKTTATKWARENEVSRTHLYRVLEDEKQSAPLSAKIESFIESHTEAVATT